MIMGKCLITKLNGVVRNNSLLRIGELRIGIKKVASPTEYSQGFRFIFSEETILEIDGDGYFTDEGLSVNKGKKITSNSGEAFYVYVSNDNVNLCIRNKYALVSIQDFPAYSSNYTDRNKFINDADCFKFCSSLTFVNLPHTDMIGNISCFENITNLDYINLDGMTNMIGDVSSFQKLNKLTYLNLYNPNISYTGDIKALHNSKCSEITLKHSKITGDLSQLPTECKFVSFSMDAGSTLKWTNRPAQFKIFAIEGNAYIENVDKMLQDLSNCVIGFSENDQIWYKTISCKGQRTSASDAAVQTLQNKGYTVSITPA